MPRKIARKNRTPNAPRDTATQLANAAQSLPAPAVPTEVDRAITAQPVEADIGAGTSDIMTAAGAARPKPSSKLGIVLALLEEPEGAPLARLVEVTGWLPHTTRAALTGLRKRGYALTSEKQLQVDGRSLSVYRIAGRRAG
jgi:hypothetical protein